MATRFYLPISGTAPLASLAVNSNWELTNSLARLPCFTNKRNTALTTTTITWPASTTQQWCWRQWQSEPMKEGYSWTTADTVSMVIGKCAEISTGGDTHLAYVVRVVSGDGTVIRGVIGLYHATSTEFPVVANAATRIHNARTNGATNFSSQIGDRIIIEIGLHGVTPAAENIQMRFGDPTATSDFALTEALTTDLDPWVELSRTVTLGAVLVVQDTTQAQTAEAPVLTQHNVLVVNNTTQAQTVDNLTLTAHAPAVVLVVADTTQAQTADNVVLAAHAPAIVLVVQDATQAQTADNIVLIQHNVLTVANATQAQSADNITLTQHNVLVVSNTVQAQTADNITLTQHNVLVVANTTQAQTADNIVLVHHPPGAVVLVVQDVTQAQISDNITLTQHNVLVVANTTQAQTADNLTLTAHNPPVVVTIDQGGGGGGKSPDGYYVKPDETLILIMFASLRSHRV